MKKIIFLLLMSAMTVTVSAQHTWTRIDTQIPGHSVKDFKYLPGFAWYHLDGSNPVAKGIYKSTDDGSTWTRSVLPVSPGGGSDLFRQIHYFNAQEAMVVYYDMVNKKLEFNYTADDGATQTLLSDTTFADYKNTGNVAPSPGETSGLMMLDKDFGYAYTLTTHIPSNKSMHLITVTRDGGKSWEDISFVYNGEGGAVRQIQFVDELTGFLAIKLNTSASNTIDDVVLKTTDGGLNWNPILTNDRNIPLVHFIDANEGYVVKDSNLGFKELVKTTDGGQTWTTVLDNTANFKIYGAATTDPFKYTTQLNFFDANNGILTGAANSGYIVARTTDGGNTWDADSIAGYTGALPLNKLQTFSGAARGIHSSGLYGEGNVSFNTSSVLENLVSDVQIYPNPAVDNITIESRVEGNAEIININGVHIQTHYLSPGKNEIHLNVPAGLYLIRSGKSVYKLKILP